MYYEINVSKNGWHVFATAERSITTKNQLERMCALFLEKFPESEGYKIEVTHWHKVGERIEIKA